MGLACVELVLVRLALVKVAVAAAVVVAHLHEEAIREVEALVRACLL